MKAERIGERELKPFFCSLSHPDLVDSNVFAGENLATIYGDNLCTGLHSAGWPSGNCRAAVTHRCGGSAVEGTRGNNKVVLNIFQVRLGCYLASRLSPCSIPQKYSGCSQMYNRGCLAQNCTVFVGAYRKWLEELSFPNIHGVTP